jgi:hypothetical protein
MANIAVFLVFDLLLGDEAWSLSMVDPAVFAMRLPTLVPTKVFDVLENTSSKIACNHILTFGL